MNTQHTPGPWVYDPSTDCVVTVHASTIVTICDLSTSAPTNNRIDNARLIAAAPDMLMALRGILAALNQPRTMPTDTEAVAWFARAAITKAT